jgi:hypothetical protein
LPVRIRPSALPGGRSRRQLVVIQRAWETVTVVCYAGYRGEQEPRRVTRHGEAQAVAEILDRWLDPEHRYFKVRTKAGAVLLLRHDERADIWTCHP